jgi:hypothetical protein
MEALLYSQYYHKPGPLKPHKREEKKIVEKRRESSIWDGISRKGLLKKMHRL